MVQSVSTNNFGPAKWVVNPVAYLGTHTTISSAIASASAGDTIAIMPATYTEDLTLVPGINLTAWGSDSSQGGSGNVNVIGKMTLTTDGTVTIYGIQLQTKSDYCVEVTGSAASRVELTNCYINCSNNTGLHLTSSGTGAYISLENCNGDTGITGISFLTQTNGSIFINDSFITNSGSSTTANAISGGFLSIQYSTFFGIFSSSNAANISFSNSLFQSVNNTTLTLTGTGSHNLQYVNLNSGTASTINISSGGTVGILNSIVGSSNANVFTGSGSITYYNITFPTNNNVNTSTTLAASAQGIVGNSPRNGAIGEQYVTTGNPSLTSTVTSIVGNITLTPGVWDISGIVNFIATTGTVAQAGISTTTSFVGPGDQYGNMIFAFTQVTISIPCFRVIITTNTTYNLLAQANFVSGGSCFGRISAVRTG